MPKLIRKRRKSESNVYCCVPQCTSWLKKDRMLSFHRFPLDKNLNKKWHTRLRMGKQASIYMRVCSKHFKEDDYLLPAKETRMPRLKNGAVPSLHLPALSHDANLTHQQQVQVQAREARLSRRAGVAPVDDTSVDGGWDGSGEDTPSSEAGASSDAADAGQRLPDQQPAEADLHAASEGAAGPVPRTEAPATPARPRPVITELLDSVEKLKIATGLPSFELLYALNELCQRHQGSDVDMVESIVLVLMKVKCNHAFSFLQIVFGKSTMWCSRTFFQTLPILSAVLSEAICWPEKEAILANMPKCFKKYQNTRVVVDCTEVPVERKTKCLKCRMCTYSQYKGCHTVKFMVGVSPDGLITHLSRVYGGRVSDKVIFENSGLVEKLEPFIDAVMADKGFMIDNVLQERCVALHRPPFLRRQRQFTKADATSTAELASARVHVERVIGRMKVFKMLVHKLPWRMVPYFGMVVKVVSAITNLSAPILADDKFPSR